MTVSARYRIALSTCLRAGMTPIAAFRMALAIARRAKGQK